MYADPHANHQSNYDPYEPPSHMASPSPPQDYDYNVQYDDPVYTRSYRGDEGYYQQHGRNLDSNWSSAANQTGGPEPQFQPYHDRPEDDEFDVNAIDPALRLRTVKTAHSVIAESIRSENIRHRRRSIFRLRRRRKHRRDQDSRQPSPAPSPGEATPSGTGSEAGDDASQHMSLKKKKKKVLPRRTVYVNTPLPVGDIDSKGEPTVRYARNKVRTSKYTLVTFLPRNLFEQFHRVANIYFLGLVILQLFPMFGAAAPQIAMLPLLFILAMTALKDGIEDWRRAQLDEEVNTSAATKLGNWKNVNQPRDPRNWFERLLGIGLNPNKPSKGVRKLREQEAKAGKHIVMERQQKSMDLDNLETLQNQRSDGLEVPGQGYPLKEIPSQISPPNVRNRTRSDSYSSASPSTASRISAGVLDWSYQVPGTAQWERTLWKKLEVGDLILLRDNEQIPADIVVLSTSDSDNLCFVETKNLDGETNLKPRRALKATSQIQSEEDLEHARFCLESEAPHPNLYSYNGVLKYRKNDGNLNSSAEQLEAVTINEMLLRGCTLRNTKWVIGLVVFTGADTKIMLNGGDTPSKRSKIEKETNFNVIMNFVILMGLCVATGLLHGYYRSLRNTSAQWYEIGAAAAENIYLDSLITFVSSLIVFQNIVPISLYITIEIVKTIQAYFIHQDIEMYYGPYDTPCVPKTWNISDDLGQIEYVFSDKTGTLTQNVMEFKKCSIQGVAFGEGITEAMIGAAKRDGKDLGTMEDQQESLQESKEAMVDTMKRAYNNKYLREEQLTLIAPDLAKRMADPSDPLRPHIVSFFRALAICHTVLADKPEPEDSPFIVDYKAESPDEAALVSAARDAGFPFITRNTHKIDIEVLGQPERWVPLRVLEFNSTRKRMSVIVRNPQGKIILFCKGADSVIYERLAPDQDAQLKEATLKDLETFANGGLRTLCIAYREMTEEEYDSWVKEYDAAAAAVSDREEAIDKASETVEHNLLILGATALEDKLQEGVPDAIAMLHQAGIKLWILTGDKLQTAIEIGYSCNLLTNEMEVMIISADSPAGARQQIEAGLNKIASVIGPPATANSAKIVTADMDTSARFAVVIDGESLRYALSDDLKPLFLSLGTQCSAVICCRVSPAQKALTVKLVKDGCKAMTLSIGDGANDVAMIQEANVGVGLFGLEGSQAAMSADYAFGQFRYLTRLLLVHGRWSYVRIADMHANFFYKNVIWTLAMFWFLIFCSFEATYLFQYTFVLLYNLVFTSLPVGILGAFDQDTNAVASMAFPQLYRRGIKGLDYTRARFWGYMLDGLYQSAIIFFIPFLVYGDGGPTWSATGRDTNDLYDLSSCIAASGVFAANLYVGINMRYWTIIPWVVIPVSILAVFAWIAIWSAWSTLDYSAVVEIIFPTFNFWATVLLTVTLAVGPHWLGKAMRQSYFYRDKDIIREAWVAGDLKDQLQIPHRRRRKHKDFEAGPPAHYLKASASTNPPYGTPQRAKEPLLASGYPNTAGESTPPLAVASPPYEMQTVRFSSVPERPYSDYSYTSPSVFESYGTANTPRASSSSSSLSSPSYAAPAAGGIAAPRPAPYSQRQPYPPTDGMETFSDRPSPRHLERERSSDLPPSAYGRNDSRLRRQGSTGRHGTPLAQDFTATSQWEQESRPGSIVDPNAGLAV